MRHQRPSPTDLASLADAWLTAEASGDDARAELLLGRTFGALPPLQPRPGFAAAVLAAAGLAPARSPLAAWLLRATVVAAVLALAAGFAVLLPAALPVLATLEVSSLLGVAGSLLAGAGRLLADALRLWEGLAGISTAIGVALRTPVGLQVLAACTVTCLLSLRLLLALSSERSRSHAPARFA